MQCPSPEYPLQDQLLPLMRRSRLTAPQRLPTSVTAVLRPLRFEDWLRDITSSLRIPTRYSWWTDLAAAILNPNQVASVPAALQSWLPCASPPPCLPLAHRAPVRVLVKIGVAQCLIISVTDGEAFGSLSQAGLPDGQLLSVSQLSRPASMRCSPMADSRSCSNLSRRRRTSARVKLLRV